MNICHVTYLIGPTDMIVYPLTVIHFILLHNVNNSPEVVVLIGRLMRGVISIAPSYLDMRYICKENSLKQSLV